MVISRELEGKEQASVEVVYGEKHQRLSVYSRSDEATLVLWEGGGKLRSWPLHAVRVNAEQPGGAIIIEAGGETLIFSCSDETGRRELGKTAAAALAAESGKPLADAALEILLEDAASDETDAELWVKRLAERVAKLDALNVGGMLAAATEGGGAKLAACLEAGATAGAAVRGRLGRYEAVTRGAPAPSARGAAARADHNARALLGELHDIFKCLDAPALADLDNLSQISLASPEGRSRLLAASSALRAALRSDHTMTPARRKMAAVRERLRRLNKAKDHLTATLSRHLNNLLIQLGNSAAHEADLATSSLAPPGSARRHHRELLPYAPFMRCLKEMDEKAYQSLLKVYVSAWCRVYERELHSTCENARLALATATPQATDEILDQVLTFVETLCNAEQDFCAQFFHLDVDVKSEGSDGERSEKSEGETKRLCVEARRVMSELFPAADTELAALLAQIEKQHPYGSMRALACVSRRVLGDQTDTGNNSSNANSGASGNSGTSANSVGNSGDARWAVGVIAGVAVFAKRGADKIIADKIAALPDAVKQAAKKPKCGILSFINEFEELSKSCEGILGSGGRRADLDRWYVALAGGIMAAIHSATHPRTPRAIIHTENYHRLHGVLSSARVTALEAIRRECRARYADALRMYVTQYFGRPLEKLTLFFEGVNEALASGVREEEICYRAAFSKHELKRVLAAYPPHEVRKSLHRLYRTVEKHVSEEGGLLQVVWRAMQEEFIEQYRALQSRMTACYPGAGLSLPLTTQEILDAFSDIAREH